VLTKQYVWQTWAEHLHRWGLRDLAADLLEATGPLNLLGAQMIYIGQPLFEPFLPDGHLKALADMLEDPAETRAFIAYLQKTDLSSQ